MKVFLPMPDEPEFAQFATQGSCVPLMLAFCMRARFERPHCHQKIGQQKRLMRRWVGQGLRVKKGRFVRAPIAGLVLVI